MSTQGFSQGVATHFDQLCSLLFDNLHSGEDLSANLAAEETLFLRLNNNRVRQNTDVRQSMLAMRYQGGGRTVDQTLTLSSHLVHDGAAVLAALARCRSEAAVLPPDPFQVAMDNHGRSHEEFVGQLLAPEPLLQAIVGPADGCDMVGFYAGGTVVRANRNSRGQSHWFASDNFFFDYSLYDGPKAVKGVYSAAVWNPADWAANLQRSKGALALEMFMLTGVLELKKSTTTNLNTKLYPLGKTFAGIVTIDEICGKALTAALRATAFPRRQGGRR